MKKIYRVEVDCAHCAGKMEIAAGKLDGVAEITINFMTQKMTVVYAEGCDTDKTLKSIIKTCRKIEPDFEIIG
ncbi:MAG: heavy-metal-associated domain-containing protein [Christensenellaceae bacterium]|nr:heavy-metal-associated domain-containing protein [Christensenellaceae bacterium]